MGEQRGGRPGPAGRVPDGEPHAQQEDGAEEPEAPVAPEGSRAGGEHHDESPAEVAARAQGRALVATQGEVDVVPPVRIERRGEAGPAEPADDAHVRPDLTGQMGWPVEGEPQRPGQQHHAAQRGDGEAHGGMGGPPPQLRPVQDQGGGRQDHDPDDGHQHRDGQQLGGEEELSEEQESEGHARRPGGAALADQDVVEDDQDERQQHERRRHEVGELETGQHEGREAVEQAAEEGGRCPAHPTPEGPEGEESGEGGGQGGSDVERGHRSPDPRDRDEGHALAHDRGLGQEVDPGRVEQGRGEEGVLPVGQRGGRPLEEPEEQRGVAAAAERVGRGARAPGVDPQGEAEGEVDEAHDRQGHGTTPPAQCGRRRRRGGVSSQDGARRRRRPPRAGAEAARGRLAPWTRLRGTPPRR